MYNYLLGSKLHLSLICLCMFLSQMGVALLAQLLHGEPVVKIQCMAPSGGLRGEAKYQVMQIVHIIIHMYMYMYIL